jgi:hypothetical protein
MTARGKAGFKNSRVDTLLCPSGNVILKNPLGLTMKLFAHPRLAASIVPVFLDAVYNYNHPKSIESHL